jgi:hypothetical protein
MTTRLGNTFRLALCVCAFAAVRHTHADDQQERIQEVVDDLKSRLSIAQTIDVDIVKNNPKLFSVVPAEQQRATFLLSVEEDFAQGLSDAELRAAVAHERHRRARRQP